MRSPLVALAIMTLVGCAPALPLTGAAPSPVADAARVLDLTRAGFAALRAHDVATFNAMLSDDFVARSPGQADVARADFLASLRALPDGIRSVEGASLDARVYGDTAVVTGVQRATVHVGHGDVVDAVAFTDVFRRSGAAWKITLSFSVPLATP